MNFTDAQRAAITELHTAMMMDHGTPEQAGARAGRHEAQVRMAAAKDGTEQHRELLGKLRHTLATSWLCAKYATELCRYEDAFSEAYEGERAQLEAVQPDLPS